MRISDWSSDVCSSDLTSVTESPRRAQPLASVAATRSAPPACMELTKNSILTAIPLRYWSCFHPARLASLIRSISVCSNHGDLVDAPPIRSEEHTSELQSLMRISYAVFCLKKKIKLNITHTTTIITTHKN